MLTFEPDSNVNTPHHPGLWPQPRVSPGDLIRARFLLAPIGPLFAIAVGRLIGRPALRRAVERGESMDGR